MSTKAKKWLDKDYLFELVQQVTVLDPSVRECMRIRSEVPFDYMDLIRLTLKFMAKTGKRNLTKVDDKLLTRKKDNEESRKLREEGNKLFLTKNDWEGIEKSLELYTKSIAYAIPNTPEMAKGFANRAVVLLRLNRPLESLEDIASALNSNYPNGLLPKLLIRQGECFSMLAEHSYIHAKFWLKQVPEDDAERKTLKKDLKDYSIKDYKTTVDPEELAIPIIQSPHAEFPCASDAINVEYTGPNGRRIVASRDISVGEVLIVEKPYLSQLFESTHYAYCSNCQESLWTGIPCDSCPNVVYCSEKCKLSAWEEYHNVECPALSLLLQNEREDAYVTVDSDMIAASLKLVIKFSNETGGLDALQERIKKFQKCYGGELKSEWYENQSLESLLTLDNNIKKLPEEHFQVTIAIAIYALFHLATTTNFLGVQYERNRRMSDKDIVLSMAHNKNVQFVGGLLIQLFLHVKYNHVVTKEFLRTFKISNSQGFVMLPFTAIVSNKCYINTIAQFIGKHLILRSIAPIKTGEELLLSGIPWTLVPKEKRLHELISDECSCRACVENWPTGDRLQGFEGRAKSPESRAMLQKVLQPLGSVQKEIETRQGNVKDRDKTLDILKNMSEAIYEGVNLPCKEQLVVFNMLTQLNQGTISKRSWRHDFGVNNLFPGDIADSMPDNILIF